MESTPIKVFARTGPLKRHAEDYYYPKAIKRRVKRGRWVFKTNRGPVVVLSPYLPTTDDGEAFWLDLHRRMIDVMAKDSIASGRGPTDEITPREFQQKLYELYKHRVIQHDLMHACSLHNAIVRMAHTLEDKEGLDFDDAIRNAWELRRGQIFRVARVKDTDGLACWKELIAAVETEAARIGTEDNVDVKE